MLTSHPAATTAACATVAKGVCTAVALDKATKKVLSSSESNTVKSAGESNLISESKVIDNTNK